MKMAINSTIRNKKAVTLMELMLALIILAFTFLPIITTIGSSTKDTDVANSYVFAQTTARNILDTLLDDVPFNSIKATEGKYTIAELCNYKNNKIDYKVDMFKDMIDSDKSDNSDKAQGTITDERGIVYTVKLYAYAIPASKNEVDRKNNELLFRYLPRPRFEVASGTTGKSQWYTFNTSIDSQYLNSDLPKEYKPYENGKVYIKDPVEKNAFQLGAISNNGSFCLMKKIFLTITWTNKDKKLRKLALYTVKANLDSEK